MRSSSLALVAALVLAGCSRVETSSTPTPDPAVSSQAKPQPSNIPSSGETSGALVLARGLRFVKASPENDVSKLVRTERAAAAADGRRLLVYVGAKWCEPCQRFHAAAQAGELDGEFPELSILEFDLDEDRDRINRAGYTSQLIPLFVLPGEDGRGSDRRFEGGLKGDRAVSNITPRLRGLLAK